MGPNKRNLKVQRREDFEFRPRDLVANIAQIYLNLGEEEIEGAPSSPEGGEGAQGGAFCLAVAGDSRSYSHDLFVEAEAVMAKINEPPAKIAQWNRLADAIRVSLCIYVYICLFFYFFCKTACQTAS